MDPRANPRRLPCLLWTWAGDLLRANHAQSSLWMLISVLLLSTFVSASNVRSTKNYDFKETDGSSPGFIMFNLDKIHPSEVFKMESPNRWVSVDVHGAVRVKEAWDYEQLGKDKTIDFWVIITSPNLNGKYDFIFLKHILLSCLSISFLFF